MPMQEGPEHLRAEWGGVQNVEHTKVLEDGTLGEVMRAVCPGISHALHTSICLLVSILGTASVTGNKRVLQAL